MSQYLLLLRECSLDFGSYSPEDIQRIVQKYEGWGNRLQKEGKLVDGRKQKDGEGRQLSGFGQDARTTDGPGGETKEVIGGFYLIDAEDCDEAVAIARDYPQLECGGTVELRQ